MKKIILTVFILTGIYEAANAQLFDHALKKIKDKAQKKIEEETSKETSKNTHTNENGQQSTAVPEGNTSPNITNSQDVKVYSKFDFIPGTTILYYENFEADAIGELPLSWNSTGKGEVVTLDTYPGKWLRLYPGTKYLTGNKQLFGNDYTIEFDLILNGTPPSGTRFFPDLSFGLFASEGKSTTDNSFLDLYPKLNNQLSILMKPNQDDVSRIKVQSKGKNNTISFTSEDQIVPALSKGFRRVAHYAIQVQKQRLRFWIDETKIFDLPRAVNTMPAHNQLYFHSVTYWPYNDQNFGLFVSNFKIATGLPDLRTKLITEGRYSTTGILFDSNSAAIRPQSYGTLKEIAQLIKDQPSLKIKIIGHTDQNGDAKSNLELSKKRAAAVKETLEKNFAIEPGTLTTDGLGESKPVSTAATATGKALNRRVEFVKI